LIAAREPSTIPATAGIFERRKQKTEELSLELERQNCAQKTRCCGEVGQGGAQILLGALDSRQANVPIVSKIGMARLDIDNCRVTLFASLYSRF
jgi:hypothetical protein